MRQIVTEIDGELHALGTPERAAQETLRSGTAAIRSPASEDPRGPLVQSSLGVSEKGLRGPHDCAEFVEIS
jgi:hypothetical protein